ncbi:NHL domain-containing protein [Wolffia australiana]
MGITSRHKFSWPSVLVVLFQRERCTGHCLGSQSYRFSAISDASDKLRRDNTFPTFFKEAIDKQKGPNYLWLNTNQRQRELLNKCRPFIILVGAFLNSSASETPREHIVAFQTMRSLQQIHPSLQVLGFQSGSSVCSTASQRQVLKTVMEEYITYPILLTENIFNEVPSEPSYLFFGDLDHPYVNISWPFELPVIEEELERCGISLNGVLAVKDSGNLMESCAENIDEPHACSPFRNLLFYYPSSVSADDHGNRLFISDTNHHRIIVTDGDGQLLDCIGCSPGFEDGDFDTSKLLRPAGSVYDVEEDCVYFVDAENCAVRRADLQKRVVETLYPPSEKKASSVWAWILDKIGIIKKISGAEKEPDKSILACPWHILKAGEDDLLVFSRGFEMLWVMSTANGGIKHVYNGFANIMETHEKVIMARTAPLEEILPFLNLPDQSKIQQLHLMSAAVKLQSTIVFCDAAGHRVLKYDEISNEVANIRFSNFGILGLPYWVPRPLENVASRGNNRGAQTSDHTQHFNVLPGRCSIKVKVHVPEGTVLVAPLSKQSVWCQARGAATEISAPALAAASVDKVGIAQQWFDELDNLAFAPNDSGLTEAQDEDGKSTPFDHKVLTIDSTVNTSPGTSEVVISAVLYLRLEDGCRVRDSARRLLTDGEEESRHETCVDLLLDSHKDGKDIVFVKPARVRLRLDCGDHPTTASRELVQSESELEVKVHIK